jgi:hypothetical protein
MPLAAELCSLKAEVGGDERLLTGPVGHHGAVIANGFDDSLGWITASRWIAASRRRCGAAEAGNTFH